MSDESTTLTTRRFLGEGHALTAIEGPEGPMFLAVEVARELGYARLSRVANKVREWSQEFREGRDFVLVDGADARMIADAATDPDTGCVVENRGFLMLLTEPGLYLFLMKSRTKKARGFRRWVAHEVLPQLRRGEIAPVSPEVSTHDQDMQLLSKQIELAALAQRTAELQVQASGQQTQVVALETIQAMLTAGRKTIPRALVRAASTTGASTAAPALPVVRGPDFPASHPIRGITALARSIGRTIPKLKADLAKVDLWMDPHWMLVGEEQIPTARGIRTEKRYAFRAGIVLELQRRERGPLFDGPKEGEA